MLQSNVGLWDRVVRVLVGAGLIAAFFLLPQWLADPGAWRWALWLGILPLASGLAGTCPAYRMLGWSTNRRDGGASHA